MRPGLSRPLDRLLSFPRSVRGKTVVKWSKSVDHFERRPLTRRKTPLRDYFASRLITAYFLLNVPSPVGEYRRNM